MSRERSKDLTREMLDKRICDVENCENTETYREFIHSSYEWIGMKISDEDLNQISDEERDAVLKFSNNVWFK